MLISGMRLLPMGNKARESIHDGGALLFAPALFFAALACVHAVSAETRDAEATAVIERLHSHLLTIMREANDVDISERYAKLAPVIADSFDTPTISRVVLGRHWAPLSEQQRREFIDVFTRLSIATYVSRFNSYNDEVFSIHGVETLNETRLLVRSELKSADEAPVSLDYLMQKTGDEWKILSVIAEGVNDLSLKRTEYSAIIKDRGYDKLLVNLREKISIMTNQAR